MVVEIEVRSVVKTKYTITAPTMARAEEILADRIDDGKVDLLADGDIQEWEIWNTEGK